MSNERGQVTVFALGMALVVFAVGGLAVDGTRAMIFRRSLQNAADAAAIQAADALDPNKVYGSGDAELDPHRARLDAIGMLEERGLAVVPTISVRDGAVEVVLRGDVSTTFLGLVGVERIPVAVEAVARPIEVP